MVQIWTHVIYATIRLKWKPQDRIADKISAVTSPRLMAKKPNVAIHLEKVILYAIHA